MSAVKKIGILTSGGDAQGMNAAVRAVVRHAINKGIEVYGVYEGYQGLMDGGDKVVKFTSASVANILSKAGTMLYSARCVGFKQEEAMQKAIKTCRELGIDGLICVGGDGTFRGASDLCVRGLPCVGIPATIDRDITCTDNTIGFSTAVKITSDLIDYLRDTDESHARCNVIEAMGRNAGYIALYAGISAGATAIVLKEDLGYDEKEIIERIKTCRARGKRNIMVIVSEGVDGYSEKLAKTIQAETGIETKFCRPAHMVRGGSPVPADRMLATKMGIAAVDYLLDGKQDIFVCERNGVITCVDIKKAITIDKLYKSGFTPDLTAPDLSSFSAEEQKEMKEFVEMRNKEIKDLLAVSETVAIYG